jgi:membrane-associated protease RseP (regulator of RpoE activity)
MNKPLILLPALFMFGIAAGIALVYRSGEEGSNQADTELGVKPALHNATTDHPMISAFTVTQASDSERIQGLEQQIELLIARIEQLEQQVVIATNEVEKTAQNGMLAISSKTAVDTPVSRSSPTLTTENLVNAGIAEQIAADIIRRKNEIDLQMLELRDRAVREGYLGTSRYSSELDTLLERDVSLREEIGDDAYDQYLYTSGQANRVNIASVMLGSPAEQAGIQKGDVILNYDDSKLFNWSELQDATTRGERGEYVNVTVLRDGQLLNLWLPRGPLGVRLSSARVKP